MSKRFLTLLATLVLGVSVSYGQPGEDNTTDGETTTATPEELKEAVDGLGERATLLENDMAILKSIKISGYVQTEWQHFDQNTNVGGRALYSDARRNFFTVRRGRIKVQYKNSTFAAVVQPDVTENGVTIKDAYGEWYMVPDLLTFTAGMFNRPNYEVELSSSTRESAERAQVTRAFYPGERDLGLMFSLTNELFAGFNPKLQLGIFNGIGTAAETDAYKDIIGRLTFPLPIGDDSPVQVDLGASIYYGGIPQTGDSISEVPTGETKFKNVANDKSGSMPGMGNRMNVNVEGQIYLDLLPFGGTIIRGEMMTGKRPTAAVAGVARDTVRFVPATSAANLRVRNQMGYYAYFIQNIGKDLQVVFKYDYFDRNTDLSGTQVTSSADAAFGVIGVGANVFIDNIRLTAWYEMPTIAADEVAAQPDVKDNKTTIRFQYKF